MDGLLGLTLLIIQFCTALCLLLHIKGVWRSRADGEERLAGLFRILINDAQNTLIKNVKIHRTVIQGQIDKLHIKAKIAEKTGDRAIALANAANIATIAIQRSLFSKPRFPTKEVMQRDALARKKVKDILGGEYEYLKAVMTDEELDILEKVQEHQLKFGDNGTRN